MGVGMQIVYLGFAGTSQIEADAASELVRLERFGDALANCHLAIESVRPVFGEFAVTVNGQDRNKVLFDARLDLIMRTGEFIPIRHCLDADVKQAIHAAFNSAEKRLAGAATGARF